MLQFGGPVTFRIHKATNPFEIATQNGVQGIPVNTQQHFSTLDAITFEHKQFLVAVPSQGEGSQKCMLASHDLLWENPNASPLEAAVWACLPFDDGLPFQTPTEFRGRSVYPSEASISGLRHASSLQNAQFAPASGSNEYLAYWANNDHGLPITIASRSKVYVDTGEIEAGHRLADVEWADKVRGNPTILGEAEVWQQIYTNIDGQTCGLVKDTNYFAGPYFAYYFAKWDCSGQADSFLVAHNWVN